MGMFGKLLGAAIDVVTTPIDIAKDIATMGGALTDKDESYTISKGKRITEKLEGAADDAAEGDLI